MYNFKIKSRIYLKSKLPLAKKFLLFLTIWLTIWLISSCGNPVLKQQSGFGENQPCTSLQRQSLFQYLSFNLNCIPSFSDTNSAISWPFPAQSNVKNSAAIVFYKNDPQAQIYYTLEERSPAQNSGDLYLTPINMAGSATLSYYSVDDHGNQEQLKRETYEYSILNIDLQLSNLTAAIVAENQDFTIDLYSDADLQLSVELAGAGEAGSGQLLQSQMIAAGQTINLAFNSSGLLPGSNKIYIYANDSNNSFVSFYVIKDVLAPYVQATPDSLESNSALSLALTAVEPATIYYTISNNGVPPADPTTASVVYSAPIALASLPGNVIEYYIKFFAVDLAGNVGDIVQKKYVIDLEVPTISILTVNNTFEKTANNHYVTSDADSPNQIAELQWQSSEEGSFSIERNGAAIGWGEIIEHGSIPANTTHFSYISHTILQSQPQFIRIYVQDKAGNISFEQLIFIKDNQLQLPRLLTPLLGLSLTSSPVTFTWQDVELSESQVLGSGVDYYQVQVAEDIGFSVNLQTSGNINPAPSPSTSMALASNKRYYWRVKAVDMVGNNLGANSGWSGARSFYLGRTAGDFNGDQLADLIVGAPAANGHTGKAYLFFGKNTSLASYDDFNPMVYEIVISGESLNDQFGYKVVIADDLNGGGLSDLVISAPFADGVGKPDTGKVYIWYGESLGLKCASYSPPCSLNAGTADAILEGEQASHHFGLSLADGGDFNQDGRSDLLVGAPNANVNTFLAAGRAYLYYGAANMNKNFDLQFNGNKTAENFSSCLANVGDINGDGYNDIIVGASGGDKPLNGADPAQQNTGTAYVYLGKSLPDTVADIRLIGSQLAGSAFGSSCTRGYDVDGDGFEDILVGAPSDSSFGLNYGKTFLYFGAVNMFTVPGHQMQAGSVNGQLGMALVAGFFSGAATSDLFIASPEDFFDVSNQDGRVFRYTNESNSICNSRNTGCSVNNGLVPTTASIYHRGGQALGIWGRVFSDSGHDVLVVGDRETETIHFYKNNIASPLNAHYSMKKSDLDGLTGEQFGFSVSSRP